MRIKFLRHRYISIFAVCALVLVLSATGCKKYANQDRLVNAAWVKNLIDTKNFGKSYVIAEVSWGGPENDYDKGHIPGAIHVNTDEVEYDYFEARSSGSIERSTTEDQDLAKGLSATDTLPRGWWDIYPDKYLMPAFAYMGIDINTTVVVYGSEPIAAARVIWALMYAGVKDVRMMDGGYAAWTKAGYSGSTETTARTPVTDFGTTTALHPEYLVDSSYVRDTINNPAEYPDDLIVDIRTKDEYTGASAPYGYIPTAGRVKGAVWGQAGDTLNDMNAYLNADNTQKPLKDIEAMWKTAGITSDKHSSFYCGTGWRSSLAWFTAYRMGWKNISNFDDSWYKWSMGPDANINPIEKNSSAAVQIKYSQLKAWIAAKDAFTIIDVRPAADYNAGHIQDAINIDLANFATTTGTLINNGAALTAVVPDKTTKIIAYCFGYGNDKIFADAAVALGYTNVYYYSGGTADWSVKGDYYVIEYSGFKTWFDTHHPFTDGTHLIDDLPPGWYAGTDGIHPQGHIPGAINIPVEQWADSSGNPVNSGTAFTSVVTDKTAPVVIYCGNPTCGKSLFGAQAAVKLGYTNVFRFQGGQSVWVENGNATTTGTAP